MRAVLLFVFLVCPFSLPLNNTAICGTKSSIWLYNSVATLSRLRPHTTNNNFIMLHLPTDWYIQSWTICFHNSEKMQPLRGCFMPCAAKASPAGLDPKLAAVNKAVILHFLEKYTLHTIKSEVLFFIKFSWRWNNFRS